MSIVKKKTYQPPVIEVSKFVVERGYSESGSGGEEPPAADWNNSFVPTGSGPLTFELWEDPTKTKGTNANERYSVQEDWGSGGESFWSS